MQSGHKRFAEDGESAEAAARPGALPAQEAPSVRGGDISNKKAEDIFKRASAANEQFDDDTVTEDAYAAVISELRTEFVRDVLVFDARVFDRSLKEVCRKTHVYGEDGVKELKRKAAEAECECAFHVLSNEERIEFFDYYAREEEEDQACGSSMTIPSLVKLRNVRIAYGATGDIRELDVSSALSDADLVGAIRRASEKVLGRPDGYAIRTAESTSRFCSDRIEKLDTKEEVYTLFERIMGQQAYDYRHNSNYRLIGLKFS
jgi:hypothetical protein